jgi:alanyl-tRNA synthetase
MKALHKKTKIGIGKNMPEQNQTDKMNETNKTVKIAVDELMKRNVVLEEENKALKAEVDELKENLNGTTTFLESQVRAKLSGELRHISRFSIEDIDHMTTEELQTMVNTLEHATAIKKPMIPGEAAKDEQDPRLTVGSLFAQPLRSKPEAS